MQPQWPKRPRLNLHFKSVYVYNDDGCCLMHDVNYYHKIIIRLKHVIELVYCSIVVPDAAAVSVSGLSLQFAHRMYCSY